METKICNKCGIEKNIDEFEFRADTHKYRNTCKQCRKEYCQKWHKDNIEHVKEYIENNKEYIKKRSKEYYLKNIDHLKKYSKEFRDNNKDYYAEYNSRYKKEHKEEISDYNREYNIANGEQRKQYKKEYHISHRENENAYRRKHNKERLLKDHIYRLKMQVRHLIFHSFERKGYSKKSFTHEILGCDYETFINHLIKTFKDNYGYEWDKKESVHIDHIIPLSTAHTEEDVIKLCHYSNLQLLKAQDNLDKSDKMDWKIKKNNEK